MPEQPPVRARIARLLDAARHRRLTLVVAGTGYGKTTALRALDAATWLDLTAADRDVSRLATRLGVRLGLAPTVGVSIGAPTGADDRVTLAEALAADLASRLADAGEVVIVLDDADQLGDELGAAWQFVRTLILQAAVNVHLVLSGRRLPEARTLLGHDRDVGRIGADELAFTDAEIGAALGADATDELVAACASITGGWPVAVALIRDRLDRAAPGDALNAVEALRSNRGVPWRAIARAVIDDEPPTTARILAIADATGVLDADLLRELGTGGADSEELLIGLQQRGLLVAAAEPGWFAASPALASAVPPSADAPTWCAVAAARFDRTGRRPLALACHQRIGADSVHGYLRAAGDALIDDGQARLVVDALRGNATDPELQMLLGRAAQLTGDLDGAIDAFSTAERELPDHALPAATAWRYAALLYLRGDVETALGALAAAQPALARADEALVAAWRASCLWSAGELDEAQRWADRGLAAALESKNPTALAAAHSAVGLVAVARGDSAANSRHQRRALLAALEAGDTVQEARIRANLCATAAGEGDFVRALAEADAAVVAARGFSVLTGHALGNRAQALESLGRLDEARASAADALDSFAATGSVMGAAAHLVIAGIDRERGDLVKARLGFQLAITLSDTIGDVHTAAYARASLAIVVAVDDPAAARALAAEALEQSSDTERPAALVAAAFAEFAGHDRAAATERAVAAETAALAANDFGALAQAGEIRALAQVPPDVARLEAALTRWDELGSAVAARRCRLLIARSRGDAGAERTVTAELIALGVAVDSGLATLVASVLESTGVRVVTLGRFQVIRGAEVVALTEWQSRKARDLLKLLIARRGRPLTREAVADALWPDEDGAALGNRLSVLLSTVRRVLDPGRAREADYYIAADGLAIAVRTDRLAIDVIELLDAVRESARLAAGGRAEPAEALLHRAEQLYQGDFLAEDPYADWAIECREEALDAAQSVLRQLARAEAGRGDDELALAHLRRLLERDSYDEQAWLALIGALIRLRRHGEARRLHARYARHMRELDVPPSPLDGLAERRP